MEPNDAAGSTSERAAELRANLVTRRTVEALLAEAATAREAAAVDADAIVEEAQQLSAQLLAESRAEADAITAAAHDRAEGILGRAREEGDDITRQARSSAEAVRARAEAAVEEHRRRVRAEVTEQVTRELEEHNRAELARQHDRQDAMIGDLEASVRILGVSLESAATNVGELLGALDGLRAHTAESLEDPGLSLVRTPARRSDGRPSIPPVDELFRATSSGSDDAGDAGAADVSEATEATEASEAGTEGGGDDEPRSATEAFLLSANVDHGDPPLPPTDDGEIGERYARDAMRATARARTRQDPETLGVVPGRANPGRRGPDEREDGDASVAVEHAGAAGASGTDAAGKPLGWLFRSS